MPFWVMCPIIIAPYSEIPRRCEPSAYLNPFQKLPDRHRGNAADDSAQITRNVGVEEPAPQQAGDEFVSSMVTSVISNLCQSGTVPLRGSNVGIRHKRAL